MSTRIWEGQAPAVAQVDAVAVTGYDAGSQYQLLVNGEVICSTSGGGTVNAVAAALASGWNAVTGNPYAVPITVAAVTADVQFTADVAGNPFTVAVNAVGGAGGFGAVTGQVSNAGPNDWGTAVNWSGSAVPVTGDDVVFRSSGVDVLWGLDQSSEDLASLVIEQTYTGKIGLDQRHVVTGADGAASSGRGEYRADYLDIGWDEARIGELIGPGAPAGSGRLKLDNNKAGASTTTIFDSGNTPADTNLPAIRLLAAHADADILVRRAPGGVGIAIDDAAETATVGAISVADESSATQVFVGAGVTMDSFEQAGGENVLRSAAAVTGITVLGGALSIEGANYTVGELVVKGGTVYPNSTPTGGAAVTTIDIKGGTVDGTRSRAARTWGTVNMQDPGSTLRADDDVITITTLNEPADRPYTLQVN